MIGKEIALVQYGIKSKTDAKTFIQKLREACSMSRIKSNDLDENEYNINDIYQNIVFVKDLIKNWDREM